MLLTSSQGHVSPLVLQQRARAYKFVIQNSLIAATELEVQWGENDANAHISNVRYFNWLEAARIGVIQSLNGGKKVASGKGVGMILGSVSNKYIRPVVGPDRVIVGHQLISIAPDKKRFTLKSMIYSYDQDALVSVGEAVMVMYDYDQLKAIELPEDMLSKIRDHIASNPKL